MTPYPRQKQKPTSNGTCHWGRWCDGEAAESEAFCAIDAKAKRRSFREGSSQLGADGLNSPLAFHERRSKGFGKAHSGFIAGGAADGSCVSIPSAMGTTGAGYLVDLEGVQQIKANKKADLSGTAR